MKKNFSKFIFLIFTIFYIGGNSFANTNYQKKEIESNDVKNLLNKNYLKKSIEQDYILDEGDIIEITINEEITEKPGPKLIRGDGTIFLPKLKNIYVAGLTIGELKNILNEAYLDFILEPAVEIEIISYRPIVVFVEGEVNSPGRKILEGSLKINSMEEEQLFSSQENQRKVKNISNSYYFPTVFDALRSAKGITQFSSLKDISLIRVDSISNGSGFKRTILDLESDLLNGDESQNIRIFDGDKIFIEKKLKKNQNLVSRAVQYDLNPKFISVNVYGRVKSPGKLRLSRNTALNDAIAVAGGAKTLRGPIKLISFQNTGIIENRKINFRKGNNRGTYNNPYLKDGDLIIIDDSFLSSSSEVINELTSPIQGIFSAYGLIKAISD